MTQATWIDPYGKCNCGADRTGPSAEAHEADCPANFTQAELDAIAAGTEPELHGKTELPPVLEKLIGEACDVGEEPPLPRDPRDYLRGIVEDFDVKDKPE